MSDQGNLEDSSQDDGPSNAFSNDGSFLEQFKKLQEQKAKAEEERKKKEQEEKPQISKPLFARVNKTKLIKPSGFKKSFASGAKLKKPMVDLSVAKAFSEDTVTEKLDSASSVSSVSPAGVQQSPTVSNPAPPPVKKSRFSDFPPPGVSTPDPSGASQPGPSSNPPVRKRKSRFSDAPPKPEDATRASVISSFNTAPQPQPSGLTAAQRQQILEQIEMNKLVAEIKNATAQAVARQQTAAGSNPAYEYDSDEDTEGGTWEHKKRMQEMMQTHEKATELTEMNKGKHHIGDFLPPEELNRFVEKVSAIKEGRTPDFSDYKEHKLTEDNVGFQLLQKAGWTEGTGLGSNQEGIVDPINKGKRSFDQSGVGAEPPAEVKQEDDTFDVYRKRMMLAYRFRPNPLNNPRRPYY